MTEEVQEGPRWLKELEDKRERRLKARLGHEAGAGSPCLTCEEKCPGLDLHFWRKICKNCKCGKENHDVNDDDIYGWAQFQLLGSKPNKTKKFVIPGRKDAVELDWIPKGVADAVESYLKDLPINLLPIKGSPAALERKQLLQKQIPLHDIDPALCHALTENEIKRMNDYIADVKQHSVGVGRVLKLNELLVANRSPMQIPQIENIILQGANRSDDLINKNLKELKLDGAGYPEGKNTANKHPLASVNPATLKNYVGICNEQSVDYQNPQMVQNMHDLTYPSLGAYTDKMLNNNEFIPSYLTIDNKNNRASKDKVPISCNVSGQNLLIPNSLHSNIINNQYPTKPGYVKDVNHISANQPSLNSVNYASINTLNNDCNVKNLQVPETGISNQIYNQFPTNPAGISDINYRVSHQVPDQDQRNNGVLVNNAPNSNCFGDNSYPGSHRDQGKGILLNKVPNVNCFYQNDNQNPKNFQIHDVNYGCVEHNFDNTNQNPSSNLDFTSNRQKIQHALGESAGSKLIPHGILQTPAAPIQNMIDKQVPVQPKNICDVTYPSNTLPQPSFINNQANTSHPGITNIKDLAYSTYDPQPLSNPDEVNATPMPVNIGIIKDIEYPTIKSAIHTQNVSEPHKNVHFNLIPEEILQTCHKCKKTFEPTALVVGVDRTDALWHADCFKCAGCNQNLADLMYFYDKSSDEVYCGRDYAKIRGIPRCQACDELIFVQEYCLAENSTFHVKHFCCFECDMPLAGQNYVMEDLQPLCLPCFELLKAEKCNTCLGVIKPDEQGANLNGVHFHADANCFVCKMCKKQLLGCKLLFKNKKLYCSAPCFGADK